MQQALEAAIELEKQLEASLPAEGLTPYQLAKVLSTVCDRTIRPQFIYNYCSKGRIPSSKVDGKLTINQEDAINFIVKYVVRNVA